MSNTNQSLANAKQIYLTPENNFRTTIPRGAVNLETKQPIPQKIFSTQRWIESQTDCAD